MGALFVAVEIGQGAQVDHPSRRWTEGTAAALLRLSLGRADGQRPSSGLTSSRTTPASTQAPRRCRDTPSRRWPKREVIRPTLQFSTRVPVT